MAITRLLVNRAKIAECRISELPVRALAEGEVLVRVGEFALTANNISYALSGDMIGYWKFFPEDDQWGIVPVWGFGEIIDSRCPEMAIGTGFWGFLPMASHVVMSPVQITKEGFIDGAEHRASLPPVYNQYTLTAGDSAELSAAADARSLLFPLFTTSYLIADYMHDNALFGAKQVIIGSASSKTGFGTAHYLHELPNPPTVVGLTSPGNTDFVRSMGLFDTVIGYDAIASLDPSVSTAFVDMSGAGPIIAAVHNHFGANIVTSIVVGATHWDAPRNREALPGAAPAFFFAPGQMMKRDAEWGQGEWLRRATAGNLKFLTRLHDVITIRHHHGAEAVAARYRDMALNRTPPTDGLILSFGKAA